MPKSPMPNFVNKNTFSTYRDRNFFGQKVISGVQIAGETLFMPHLIFHSVYNLDWTVAVGDNLLYSSALEEVIASGIVMIRHRDKKH
jgi:hypothetical protein